MRNVTKVELLALLALLIGALFGCGGTQPKSGSPLYRDSRGLDSAAVDLITNSGAFPDRQYLVAMADEVIAERCMRAAGVTWTGYVDRPSPGSDEDRLLDLASRQRRGYGLSTTDEEPSAQHGPADDDPRMAPALFGPSHKLDSLTVPGFGVASYPVEGCLAKAHATVYGDVATWARLTFLPPQINLSLAKAAQTDRRHKDATQRWSRCMADHHYQYATPGDIHIQLARQYETDQEPMATQQTKEIALAVQDAHCDHEAQLTMTELALRREGAQAIDAMQRTKMAQLSASFDQAVDRARSISR